jgi:hypothetical protein
MASNPDLLTAARKQLAAARRSHAMDDQEAAGLWLLAWMTQDGIDRDDLVDILKDEGIWGP